MVFSNLPLNTNRVYTEITLKCGCKLYVPAESHKQAEHFKLEIPKMIRNEKLPPAPPNIIA